MDKPLLTQYEQTGRLPSEYWPQLQALKLVVFDVDGVLTDGCLVYGAQGEELKHFNVKDGVALKLLPKWGVHVAVITAKDSAPLRKRMDDLGVTHFYPNCHDKKAAFLALLDALSLDASQAAYVGDDVIDLQVMPEVGMSFCPADAHVLVQRHCVQHHCACTLFSNAGEGVAREVCDLILATRMPLEIAYDVATKPEFERK
ncbi:HAD-IIIA family hydrolase [Marinomonas agarivorans]|nr:HAD-IIIA family hydrolase [Marinomonas agarivorans]